jgi:hypothetical protein
MINMSHIRKMATKICTFGVLSREFDWDRFAQIYWAIER